MNGDSGKGFISSVPVWLKLLAAFGAFGVFVGGLTWAARGVWDQQLLAPAAVAELRREVETLRGDIQEYRAATRTELGNLRESTGRNAGEIEGVRNATNENECKINALLRGQDALDC